MKKALLVLLALAMIGSFAFADVKVAGLVVTGVRADINLPSGGTATNDIRMYEGFRGFDTIATINLHVTTDDGMFGYDAEYAYVPSIAVGDLDQAQGWWKMFDGMATLYVGTLIPNSFATAVMEWGDSQFNGAGLDLTLKLVEGLEIGYMLPLATVVVPAADGITKALQGSKIGASYAMANMFTVKGAVLLSATANAMDAYAGLAVSAIENLGLNVEYLGVNIGDTTTGTTDVMANLSYQLGAIGVGVWGEVCLPALSGATMGWVVGPNVSYGLMDKVTVSAEFDIGNNNNLGGWYGLTSLGAGDAAKMSWAPVVTLDFASPAGKIRVRGAYQSLLNGDGAAYVRLEYRWFF